MTWPPPWLPNVSRPIFATNAARNRQNESETGAGDCPRFLFAPSRVETFARLSGLQPHMEVKHSDPARGEKHDFSNLFQELK